MAAFLVKIVQGSAKLTFRCAPEDTALSLKRRIQAHTYLPVQGQKLKLKGKEIPDEAVLTELGLRSSSRIMLMFSELYYVPHSPVQKLHQCGTDFLALKTRTTADASKAGLKNLAQLEGKEKMKVDEQVTRLLLRLDAVEVDAALRPQRKALYVTLCV